MSSGSNSKTINVLVKKEGFGLTFTWQKVPWYIGEIRTHMLVYEKGGVIKHIKAPARVKVELPDLWRKKMRDDVIFQTMSTKRFGISLKQREKLFYKVCYSTSSRIYHVTRESQDEQRPVLLSAHLLLKICWEIPFMETCYIPFFFFYKIHL